MSTSNTTLKMLGILDSNIHSYEAREEYRGRGARRRKCIVLFAELSYQLTKCPKCQFPALRPNGHKLVHVQLRSVEGQPVVLDLNKQRWMCDHCHHTSTATTPVVKPGNSIANKTKEYALKLAKQSLNLKAIAKISGVSPNTVSRTLNDAIHFRAARFLPTDLCFDELRTTHGWMSFICVDAHSHKLVTMLGDRYNASIKNFFINQYSLAERKMVRHIVMDMNASYASLVHEVFPNAEVVYDRFHIVQLLGRALDQIRIQCMKSIDSKTRVHKALKSCWRLFHKIHPEARKRQFKFGINEEMTEQEVIDLAINDFPELKHAYETYVTLHDALMNGKPADLEDIIKEYFAQNNAMDIAISTLRKNLRGVVIAAKSPLSNGPIEGVNRKIKELKRGCYGFYNQLNMFKRIYQITA